MSILSADANLTSNVTASPDLSNVNVTVSAELTPLSVSADAELAETDVAASAELTASAITAEAEFITRLAEMPEEYTGSYTVTPSTSEQTLETEGLLLTSDVTVSAIPVTEEENAAGGVTLTIGG